MIEVGYNAPSAARPYRGRQIFSCPRRRPRPPTRLAEGMRRVVADGVSVVYDPKGVLAGLPDACGRSGRRTDPEDRVSVMSGRSEVEAEAQELPAPISTRPSSPSGVFTYTIEL